MPDKKPKPRINYLYSDNHFGGRSLCKKHKPHGLEYGFSWFAFVEKQEAKAHEQTECPDCGRWLWPIEL